jgi:hypothetical protein
MPERRNLKNELLGASIAGVGMLAILGAGHLVLRGETSTSPVDPAAIPPGRPLNLTETPQALQLLATPDPEQPVQKLPHDFPNNWDCATINNRGPKSKKPPLGYNPNKPEIPNAFRAIMAADNRKVVEPGPYVHLLGPLGSAVREHNNMMHSLVVDSLDGFDPKTNPVHNGDEICVRFESNGYNSNSNGIVYQREQSEKHQNNVAVRKSINTIAAIRSKQGF